MEDFAAVASVAIFFDLIVEEFLEIVLRYAWRVDCRGGEAPAHVSRAGREICGLCLGHGETSFFGDFFDNFVSIVGGLARYSSAEVSLEVGFVEGQDGLDFDAECHFVRRVDHHAGRLYVSIWSCECRGIKDVNSKVGALANPGDDADNVSGSRFL